MFKMPILALIVMLSCAGPSPAQDDTRNVMQPTLPTGTVVLLNPEHPRVEVSVRRDGDVTVIEGSLPRPATSIPPDISDWQFCRSNGAECRQFHVRLLEGSVASARPIRIYVKKSGEKEWIKLETKPGGSKFIGSYREFDGFAAMPFFLTVNCAVHDHELMSWEVRNWSASALEFRIEISVRTCPRATQGEDDAD